MARSAIILTAATRTTCLALVAMLLAPTAAAEAPPGGRFDVVRYDLALTPDVANGTVAGRETIAFRATADGVRRIDFSGNALVVEAATLDGTTVAARHLDDALVFDLRAPLVRGRLATLTVSYHGRPARGLMASRTGLYTSYFACDWMVCRQNDVGDKADFSLALRVPAAMETLSVGRLVSRRPGAEGDEVHRWRAPRPYPAYLFGFAVGRFAKAAATVGTATLAYLSDVADRAELERRFAATPDMVRFLAAKAGMPLPVAEYGQLLVAGAAAQEAATYAVLGVDSLPDAAGDPVDGPADDWAIVHELTHQWWGNLVTCATLRDFWLNEGVTTFMTAAWKEHRYGRAAYDADLRLATERLASARAAGFDKPLAWDGTYPTLRLRRAVQYSKGALFMAHLRATLGDAVFWSGLRRYTRAHAGSTVTSIDLEHAMERASGRDLRPLFAEWVFGAGRAAAPAVRPAS